MLGAQTRRPQALVARARATAEAHPAITGLLVFGALAAISRPASFRTPLERDTGQYLYAGQTILDGGTPYADAANNKGPVTFLLFAAIRLIDGHSVIAVRLVLLLFAALAALAVAAYVTRLAGRDAGFLAGAVFAVLGSATALQGEDPNTEQFGIVLMAGAWWLSARGDRRSAAGAGALSGAAILMNAGFVAIAPIVLFELWRGAPAARRAGDIGAALAGGVAVAVPVLIWIATAGALGDMREQVLAQASDAVSGNVPAHLGEARVDNPLSPRSLLEVPAGALWMGGLVGALAAMAQPRLRAAALGALVWIVVMWVRVKLARYSFPHHYYPAMPGIAAGLSLGIASIWGVETRRRVACAALVLTIPVWAYVVGPQWRLLDVPPFERWGPNSSFALAYPVADFVRAHTEPGDRLMMSGAEPEVYWLADRRAPTRFFDVYPIYWRTEYSRERLADLRRDPPEAIGLIGLEPDPDVQAVLRGKRYRLAYDVNGAKVWLRQPGD